MLRENKWFYFASGGKAASIQELKLALNSMDPGTFSYHVNNQKNDFADWIEGVFNNHKLAEHLREVSEKEGMQIILEDYLKESSAEPKKASEKKAREIIIKSESEPEKTPRKTPGKNLSKRALKKIVRDTEQFIKSEKKRADKPIKTSGDLKQAARKEHPERSAHMRLIVKEFIYGFVLGLIFGIVLVGILFNLKPI